MLSCPGCGVEGQVVGSETVRGLLRPGPAERLREDDFRLCTTASCQAVYYGERTGQVFERDDVRVRVWFKDGAEDVPICYCANLTRGEIKAQVAKCHLGIDAIRAATGKTRTGHCRAENPSGRCCHQVFQELIAATATKPR